MDFNHSEDRRMLADTLGRYISNEYDIQQRHEIANSPKGFCPTRWEKFAELGALGALFSEEYGGYGGNGFDLAVVFEELGKGLVVEPFLNAVLAGSILMQSHKHQHQETLALIVAGSKIGTLASEEPESRYCSSFVKTQAVRAGSDYVLTGMKTAAPFGDQADYVLVSARTSGMPGDGEGISLFLVPTDQPGLEIRGFRSVDGTRLSDLAFRGVVVGADALVGKEGEGLETIEYAVARGTLALCAEALGAMEVIKTHTIEYLKTRKQFGRPIGSFQVLQHRIVEVLMEIEQARSAVINAAAALDEERAIRERAISAAKYSIGHIGRMVAEECIQMHGGIGLTWELPMPHFAKRLVMIDHMLGNEDYHLERFINLQVES